MYAVGISSISISPARALLSSLRWMWAHGNPRCCSSDQSSDVSRSRCPGVNKVTPNLCASSVTSSTPCSPRPSKRTHLWRAQCTPGLVPWTAACFDNHNFPPLNRPIAMCHEGCAA
eukprot:3854396-Amphidinium_carterae.3